MKKAKFAMAFHSYQPVDNFGWEFERAYQQAYAPFLSVLEEFTGVKVSMHFSGNLLEWLEKEKPEYINRLNMLLDNGQLEIIGGGCFEPVMALIPERDRREQIRLNGQILKRLFDIEPRGAWLAEKVWEPSLAETLSSCGLEYTIVDDYHFLRAGVEEDKLYGPCRTGSASGETVVFPSLTRLRYSMPFRDPEVTVDYIKSVTDRNKRDTSCFFFADDAEKFGAWPYTNNWVYGKGWLKKFFMLLDENSDWLSTEKYSDIIRTEEHEQVDELPESSYAEMMEWSGGDFKNFLKKYPEAGRMHKRMLAVSDNVDSVIGSFDESLDEVNNAKRELLKAQANCAYWHGTFGGLYFPHLRSGVYSHLIKAQKIVDSLKEHSGRGVRAIEYDPKGAKREVVLGNDHIDVFIKPSEGGSLVELDHKPSGNNVTNIMTRKKEQYHDKLQRGYFQRVKKARSAVMNGEYVNVHDVLGVKDKGLKKVLFYDDYERHSFLTHILPASKRPWKDLQKGMHGHDRFLKGRYSCEMFGEGSRITQVLSRRDEVYGVGRGPLDLEAIKTVSVADDSAIELTQTLVRHSLEEVTVPYGLEFNFLIWDDRYVVKPRKMTSTEVVLKDKFSGLTLALKLDCEREVFSYPIFTVNETEEGLVKTFQGLSLLVSDKFRAVGSNKAKMKILLRIG